MPDDQIDSQDVQEEQENQHRIMLQKVELAAMNEEPSDNFDSMLIDIKATNKYFRNLQNGKV